MSSSRACAPGAHRRRRPESWEEGVGCGSVWWAALLRLGPVPVPRLRLPPPGRRRAAANAAGSLGRLPLSRPALFRVLHGGWCVFFLPGGGRGVVARRPSRHPWRGALALTVAGSRCRVTGRCRGSARPSSSPRFLASRVRPAPVRVPSCRVPARRFKDPRGGRPSAPGVGGRWGP